MFKNTIEPHLMKSVRLKVHLLQFSCLRYFPSSIIHPLTDSGPPSPTQSN
uniref:Uncharacterized protein n=1 Tax=Anguilla anguilla TaxID=7936 RepID=A0A0E9VSA9_ANGAN